MSLGEGARVKKKLLQPIQLFLKKDFYLLASFDSLFILFLFGLSSFIETQMPLVSQSYTRTLFLAAFFILLVMVGYSASKYLFYSVINQKRSFTSIITKHTLAMVILGVLAILLQTILFGTLKRILFEKWHSFFQISIAVILLGIAYILFLQYHRYSELPLLESYKKTLKSLCNKQTYHFVYADAVIIILIYLVLNIITYLLRIILLYVYDNIPVLNMVYEKLGLLISFITIVTLFTANKIIAYEVKV